MAVIEFGAFRRELVFSDLSDLQVQLTTLRFESADLLQLLGLTPAPAPATLADARPATAPVPRTMRVRVKAPDKSCPHCGKALKPQGAYRHIAACQRRQADAATEPASATSHKPPATTPPADHLDITRRALARCHREIDDPATNTGRRAVLKDEVKRLEAKLDVVK
jgi:hypothetical protein